METSITHAPLKRPARTKWLTTAGLALALACLFIASPLRAEYGHRGGQQHNRGHDVRQEGYRHDDRRRGNEYGRNEGYLYGAPPIAYGPEAAPGINLFLPL